MEATIVVLLDYEGQRLRLYGEVNKTISFEDSFLLPALLKGKDVLYIRTGDIMDCDGLIEQVAAYFVPPETVEKRFVHPTVEGYTKVQEIGITFAGPRDARPLDKLGYDIFERSEKMRDLLAKGVLEVITESEAAILRKPLPNKNLRDKALDDMLLKKSVNQFMDEDDDDMWNDENEVTGDEADRIVSESEQMIRKGFGKAE
jgi:hypothetical protein